MVFFTGTGLFAEEKLQVFVSIVPQKYFVERIARDLAEVAVLVTPGNSPATCLPTPAHAARKIAETIDGAVVSINPLAPDYLDNMVRMAETIATALAH